MFLEEILGSFCDLPEIQFSYRVKKLLKVSEVRGTDI